MSMLIEWMGNIICSLFLTHIINNVTLSTGLQVGFVFCYFVIANKGLYCIYKRKAQQQHFGRNISLFLIALVVGVLTLPKTYTFEYSTDITLIAKGEKNQASFGNEVWLEHIFVEGKEVYLDEIPIEGEWKYIHDDNVIYANPEAGNAERLVLSLPAGESVTLVFDSHAWSGIVEIEGGKFLEQIDLYSEEYSCMNVDIMRTCEQPEALTKVLLCIGYTITLFRVFSLLIQFVVKKEKL